MNRALCRELTDGLFRVYEVSLDPSLPEVDIKVTPPPRTSYPWRPATPTPAASLVLPGALGWSTGLAERMGEPLRTQSAPQDASGAESWKELPSETHARQWGGALAGKGEFPQGQRGSEERAVGRQGRRRGPAAGAQSREEGTPPGVEGWPSGRLTDPISQPSSRQPRPSLLHPTRPGREMALGSGGDHLEAGATLILGPGDTCCFQGL